MDLRQRAQPTLRRIAWGHALTRALVGTTLLVRPRTGTTWLGPAVADGGGRVALDAFAVREAALGVGVLRSLALGHPVRLWFRLGVAFEVVDAVATLRQRRHLPASRLPGAVALFAGSGAIGGIALGLLLEE